MSSEIQIFNRKSLKLHRDRSAKILHEADFLFHEVASRMATQFGSTITKKFSTILELGARNGILQQQMPGHMKGIGYYSSDISEKLLGINNSQNKIVSDDEFLPFKAATFDLIISNLNLHTVNDLVGTLAQAKHCLQKGGMFMASLFGIDTLKEVKHILSEAETRVNGSLSPRIFPYIDVRSGAALLQRLSFAEPVSINEVIKVKYDNLYDLFADLKAMGESNILLKAQKTIPSRKIFALANEMFLQTDREVSFEIVYISGWKF
jgi:NADH dehydrogenase [ubiquinone] 1 alpha subcomplex assembly factor 5